MSIKSFLNIIFFVLTIFFGIDNHFSTLYARSKTKVSKQGRKSKSSKKSKSKKSSTKLLGIESTKNVQEKGKKEAQKELAAEAAKKIFEVETEKESEKLEKEPAKKSEEVLGEKYGFGGKIKDIFRKFFGFFEKKDISLTSKKSDKISRKVQKTSEQASFKPEKRLGFFMKKTDWGKDERGQSRKFFSGEFARKQRLEKLAEDANRKISKLEKKKEKYESQKSKLEEKRKSFDEGSKKFSMIGKRISKLSEKIKGAEEDVNKLRKAAEQAENLASQMKFSRSMAWGMKSLDEVPQGKVKKEISDKPKEKIVPMISYKKQLKEIGKIPFEQIKKKSINLKKKISKKEKGKEYIKKFELGALKKLKDLSGDEISNELKILSKIKNKSYELKQREEALQLLNVLSEAEDALPKE